MADESNKYAWETWTWDGTLFKGAAPYYRRGRTPYAPGLAATLAAQLGLDGKGRLLDVGCGPGIITLLLASHFEGVVGLDPDSDMLAEARRSAIAVRVTNATWLLMRAEDLPGRLGVFRVITFAQSFHWMDRPRVARSVRAMLDHDGTVVHIDHESAPEPRHIRPSEEAPLVPEGAIDELRRAWLGPERRAGQGYRNGSPSGEDEIFKSAGFAPERVVIVPDDRVLDRSVDDVIAGLLSMSSTAPHLFGDRLDDFVNELRQLLHRESPSGRFSVPLVATRLRIHTPLERDR